MTTPWDALADARERAEDARRRMELAAGPGTHRAARGCTMRTARREFMSRVRKTVGGCWLWRRTRPKYYGTTSGRVLRTTGEYFAHRAAWVLYRGAVPAGMCVCHRCDDPRCVRPSHLFPGTKADNSADMVRKGRQARFRRMPLVVRHTHRGLRVWSYGRLIKEAHA